MKPLNNLFVCIKALYFKQVIPLKEKYSLYRNDSNLTGQLMASRATIIVF
jgi:hypothetical protein